MEATKFYPHTCTIQRASADLDENGNEIFIPIYEGECGLQRGGNGNTFLQGGQFFDSPLIIIPDASVIVLTNDYVVVTDENGRIMRFTAEQAESVHDAEIGGCTIWLKTGDTIYGG